MKPIFLQRTVPGEGDLSFSCPVSLVSRQARVLSRKVWLLSLKMCVVSKAYSYQTLPDNSRTGKAKGFRGGQNTVFVSTLTKHLLLTGTAPCWDSALTARQPCPSP